MSEPRRPRHRIDPSEPRDPYAAEGIEPPPKNVAEALNRARLHGRAAAAESRRERLDLYSTIWAF